MTLSFQAAQTAGSTVLLVTSPVSKELQPQISQRLLSLRELPAQRVAFLSLPRFRSPASLDFAEGIFSASASACAGLLCATAQGFRREKNSCWKQPGSPPPVRSTPIPSPAWSPYPSPYPASSEGKPWPASRSPCSPSLVWPMWSLLPLSRTERPSPPFSRSWPVLWTYPPSNGIAGTQSNVLSPRSGCIRTARSQRKLLPCPAVPRQPSALPEGEEPTSWNGPTPAGAYTQRSRCITVLFSACFLPCRSFRDRNMRSPSNHHRKENNRQRTGALPVVFFF